MPFFSYTKDVLDAAQGKWPASGGQYDENMPAERRRNRPKSIEVFQNRIIERVFARAHPITPIIWFGPFIAYGLYVGLADLGIMATAGWFFGGWLLWTLLEYCLHRFLFHMGAETPER